MKRKAIIIGATGRIGQALTRELSSLYETVIVVGRTQPKYFSGNMHFYAVADFDNLADSLAVISLDESCDAFCCLWTDYEEVDSEALLKKIHHEYPLLFATICRQKGVQRLFFLSKSGANVAAQHPVLQAKGRLEEALLALDFQVLVAFWVDRLTLPKNDNSIKNLGKRMVRLVGRIVPQDRPLTPAQVGSCMALVAYRTLHDGRYIQSLQARTMGQPLTWFGKNRRNKLERITHHQMLMMTK